MCQETRQIPTHSRRLLYRTRRPQQDVRTHRQSPNGSHAAKGTLGEEAWGNHVQNTSQWALVGIPSESVSRIGTGTINGRLVFTPLSACEPPKGAGQRADNQFFARVTDNAGSIFQDADGLSGSPVFAIRPVEGVWRYKVIGVQSGWYRSLGILAICPVESFAHSLQTALHEAGM